MITTHPPKKRNTSPRRRRDKARYGPAWRFLLVAGIGVAVALLGHPASIAAAVLLVCALGRLALGLSPTLPQLPADRHESTNLRTAPHEHHNRCQSDHPR